MIKINYLKCLQINLQHSLAASLSLSQTISELNLDLIFIQEPYFTTNNKNFPNLPLGYSVYHSLTEDHAYGSAIIYKSNLKEEPLPMYSNNEITAIDVKSWDKQSLATLYTEDHQIKT